MEHKKLPNGSAKKICENWPLNNNYLATTGVLKTQGIGQPGRRDHHILWPWPLLFVIASISVSVALDPAPRGLETAIFVMRIQTLKEGRWIFGILALLMLASWWFVPWFSLPFLALIIYTFAFFRDPERLAPSDPDVVLAAADGVVADIAEIDEPEVLKARMQRVGIFLSVFDVHTNRAPIDGRVTYRQHHKGLCLDARSADCSTKNEAMTWAFENARGTIIVRQLTGAIARRIVGWSKVGDALKKGERFGMIRFGSRTEVYLPLDANVVVKVGDRVAGGLTVIARLP